MRHALTSNDEVTMVFQFQNSPFDSATLFINDIETSISLIVIGDNQFSFTFVPEELEVINTDAANSFEVYVTKNDEAWSDRMILDVVEQTPNISVEINYELLDIRSEGYCASSTSICYSDEKIEGNELYSLHSFSLNEWISGTAPDLGVEAWGSIQDNQLNINTRPNTSQPHVKFSLNSMSNITGSGTYPIEYDDYSHEGLDYNYHPDRTWECEGNITIDTIETATEYEDNPYGFISLELLSGSLEMSCESDFESLSSGGTLTQAHENKSMNMSFENFIIIRSISIQ